MNKKTAVLSTLTLVCSLALASVTAPRAHAVWMQQSQSSNTQTSTSCTGTCSTSSSSTQSQDQSFASGNSTWMPGSTGWNGTNHWNGSNWMGGVNSQPVDTSGQVTLSWGFRGGTCTIRYTEATSRFYQYSTSTDCDNGQLTIGGLVPGRAYRFQVRDDAGAVTRAVRIVAN